MCLVSGGGYEDDWELKLIAGSVIWAGTAVSSWNGASEEQKLCKTEYPSRCRCKMCVFESNGLERVACV